MPGLALVWAAACTFDGLDGYTSGSDASVVDGGPEASADAPADQVTPLDAPSDTATAPCNLAAPFGPATKVSSIDTTRIEGQAELSPDQLTVYFESDRLNTGLNVFTAARPDSTSPFGPASPLASLNFTGADTWNVTLTGDGLTAYLVTDQGGADHMYTATRASSLASFGTPSMMPFPIAAGEQPYVRPDGKVLYYSDGTSSTKIQIARAKLGGSPTVAAVTLAVPGSHDVGIPVVDPTDTLLYFAVFDRTNPDSYDIWMATRATVANPWSTPVPVTELNTPSFEAPSWISADGCTLYFTHGPAADASVDWDVYSARRP